MKFLRKLTLVFCLIISIGFVNVKAAPIDDLVNAINKENSRIIIKLVENNLGLVRECDKNGFTALMYALQNGKLKIARYLISKGADINQQNKYGSTAITYAKHTGLKIYIERQAVLYRANAAFSRARANPTPENWELTSNLFLEVANLNEAAKNKKIAAFYRARAALCRARATFCKAKANPTPENWDQAASIRLEAVKFYEAVGDRDNAETCRLNVILCKANSVLYRANLVLPRINAACDKTQAIPSSKSWGQAGNYYAEAANLYDSIGYYKKASLLRFVASKAIKNAKNENQKESMKF